MQNGKGVFLMSSNTIQSPLNHMAIFIALSFDFKGTENTNADFPHPD